MKSRFAIAAVLILLSTQLFANAKITIVNRNSAGVGFNDPTPAEPVGGNTGITIGEQRLIAFRHAADLWQEAIDSPVEIFIQASFEPLSCDATSGTLGSAGPLGQFADFTNAPLPGTWYVSALANKLAGRDLTPGAPGTSNDDIRARFNSNIGKATCLPTMKWYYGLDGKHGSDVDLVVVLLHEFAHGLGFINMVDRTTGDLFLGQQDIFSVFTLDSALGLHWNEMTAFQRQTSATSGSNLVWDGLSADLGAPFTLGPTATLSINAPASVAGTYQFSRAAFGGEFSLAGLTTNIVIGLDPADELGASTTDACTALTNAADVRGRIALVDRGTCTFVIKAKNVQAAGATGLVIVNNQAGGPQGMSGTDDTITIPVIGISMEDGARLKAEASNGLIGTLRLDLSRLSGVDAQGHVLLYAPNPIESGSSISHWDTSAFPNLLMEPAISGDLAHDVDLTENFFADIGWDPLPRVSAKQTVKLVSDIDGNGGLTRGETLRYTVTMENRRTGPAQNVTFRETLDVNTTLVPGSVTADGGSVLIDAGTITVAYPNIPPDATRTMTFDAVVNAATPETVRAVETQGRVFWIALGTLTDDPATAAAVDSTRIGFASSAKRKRALGR